ncbi:hypothetical protein LUX39_38115 [Actinomadura madurae]|nr:hypothetical protein [Actinomadura madurae]MCQ0018885.1 hypothetical protein [Actinomadura madurae]
MLDDERRGAVELGAGGQALREPAHHQQRRRPQADRGLRGQQPDGGGRHGHQQDDRGERAPAAQPVAEVAEQDAAEGPGDERDPQHREGAEQVRDLVAAGEEGRPDLGRQEAVDREVVPLQEVADTGRGEDARRLPLRA